MPERKLTLGELFAGYGGLGLAVEEVFNARLAWYAEFDPSASKIMAHHWPDLTNYGDVTAVDWTTVPPVDIISGGSPCQDLSLAGARRGMTEGTRSNLWESMREAIATIQPTYVVWENVRGALSAKAHSASDLEHNEGLLGGGAIGHLRALGRVLGDLADLGYDCQWHGLRASDIGAPHQRFRVFVLATRRAAVVGDAAHSSGDQERPARPGSDRERQGTHRGSDRTPEDADAGRRNGAPAPDTGSPALGEHAGGSPAQEARTRASDRSGDHGGERPHGDRREAPAHTHGDEPQRGRGHGRLGGTTGKGESGETQREWLRDAPRNRSMPDRRRIEWGPYTPAVRRWEQVLGRPAPSPTEPTPNSRRKCTVHGNPQKGRPGEEMRDMRDGSDPEAVQEWSPGRQERIPSTPPLLSEMREHAQGSDTFRAPMASETVPESGLRGMRDEEPSTCSPQGPELGERLPNELSDTVRVVPPEVALARGPEPAPGRDASTPVCTCQSRLSPDFVNWMMGLDLGWVTNTPDISRNDQIKALGNGVVPQQAAAALTLMLTRQEHIA